MYEDMSAVVLTPEGETNQFVIDTGVLQGDTLAPFLFIICLDYALSNRHFPFRRSTLKPRRSKCHPAVVQPHLDFADDVALLEDCMSTLH